jgi:putative SOS response-associated peptidase YedK
MCSRFTLIDTPARVARALGLDAIEEFPPRYNIAPTQPIGIVRLGFDGRREFALVRWGLLPGWVKDPQGFRTLFSGRAETLLAKPAFRSAARYRRCLLPMSGFYDWTGPRGERQPVYFSAVAGGPFAVAGLWEHWMGADGSELDTALVVTCPANRVVAGVGERMPAIIGPADQSAWLDWREVAAPQAIALLRPAAGGLLHGVRVDARVNDPRIDDPDLLRPIEDRLL